VYSVQCSLCWCTYITEKCSQPLRSLAAACSHAHHVWGPLQSSARVNTGYCFCENEDSHLCPLPTPVICGSLSPRPLAIILHALTFSLWDKILYVKFWFLTAMILRFLSSLFWYMYTKFRGVAYQKTTILRSAFVFLSFVIYFHILY
jgi:hypothetical protein